ncbi:MAG: M56 family metallopeptidase [Chloroflexi bacterium]|nr:M56 family metallopeptidase [Chloroflexota bacterium]
MHTFFLLSALLIAGLLGGLGAFVVRMAPSPGRRPVALAVLAAPPAVLGLAVLHLVPRLWPECAPLEGWDRVTSITLLGGIAGVALGALALNVARLILMERLLRGCPPLTHPPSQVCVAALAARFGTRVPDIRVLHINSPLAVSGGLVKPTIVLSSGLVGRLDAREIEAVLAHEVAHLARRDHLTRWLGRLGRDMLVYLPGGWAALRALEADEELGADVRAVGATGRPLAMASALGKLWRDLPAAPALGLSGVPGYGGTTSVRLLEDRLQRLLDGRVTQPRAVLPGRFLAGAGVISIGELAPRLLNASATALPLMCGVRLP